MSIKALLANPFYGYVINNQANGFLRVEETDLIEAGIEETALYDFLTSPYVKYAGNGLHRVGSIYLELPGNGQEIKDPLPFD